MTYWQALNEDPKPSRLRRFFRLKQQIQKGPVFTDRYAGQKWCHRENKALKIKGQKPRWYIEQYEGMYVSK